MKYVIVLILSIFIIGCPGPSYEWKSLQSVESEFPNSKIVEIPGQYYKFLVKDNNGKIWYVTTNAAKVSYKKEIFE